MVSAGSQSDGRPVEAFYAPILPSERWTSIDLYRRNYEGYLAQWFPERRLASLLPNADYELGPWKRRYYRDLAYPRIVARQARRFSDADRPPLHIFDHSYGHLQKAWSPAIIHCRDLNHYVLPSLTGVRLLRWQRKVARLKHAERVVAISRQLAGEITEHLGIPEERIRVIYHGVDLECFRPGRLEEAAARFPELAALRADRFLVLNIGTNLPRKNLETIYAAIMLLRARGVPAHLVRIGENEHRAGEAERIAAAGLTGHLTQAGLLKPDEVALVCNLCHAFSFASEYEGFGRPTLEAQASGLPCVLARSSCLPEIGGDGALYHEPKDAEELADHLEQVASHADHVAETVERGIENARRFTWRRHLEQILDLYDEVRRERAARSSP